jgi:hypothetical protein
MGSSFHRVTAAWVAAVVLLACGEQRLAEAQSSPAPNPPTQPSPAEANPTAPTATPAPESGNPQTGTNPAPTPPTSPPAAQSTSPSGIGSPAAQQPALPDAPKPAQAKPTPTDPSSQFAASVCAKLPCPTPLINWYMRFENGPQVKPLTPKEKAWLATKNLIDPFNLLTVFGEAGISVAADSHSPYGPGFPGFGRNAGVSFTQDMTGEFFNTFLIPSVMHQDPHYHRMPHASYAHRVFHAIDQVVWTQGDNGKGMLNYADLVGFAIDDEIGNLYVPGRETDAGATAERYAIGLATAPIDNFISEFLPDVARHIHVQVVVIQRIINQVAQKDSGGS